MKARLLAWALEHRDGARTLVAYYRDRSAYLREYEASSLEAENHALAAMAAREAVMVEGCWTANERRLNFWDMVACWLGAASVVPGRGLNSDVSHEAGTYVTTNGKRPPRVKPTREWHPEAIPRPRVYIYVDAWQGGSLCEVGFEVNDGGFDPPVFRRAIQLEARPGSLLDRLFCLMWKVKRWR